MENNNSISELYCLIKRFIGQYITAMQISLVERLAAVCSSLILLVALLLLGGGALLLLALTLAAILAPWLGSWGAALGTVTSGYLLLITILYLLRARLVVRPLIKLFLRLLLPQNKKQKP